ncbi:MAG: RdgB/HAM1 family non-canonical purine NTP pyrophosphatase [Archangiaceae bacterium]|nr:RdgB/HAM1 family non-canonical purine NTP pyrophosphatase [Archangiaceae bacterium]
MKLLFATTNAGKLAELRELLPGVEVISAAEAVPHLEVEEDRDTFEANAEKKARSYLQASGLPSLADDSGLCVEALGGRPGVQSARYAPSDAERITRLLAELQRANNRKAHFTCALCVAFPSGELLTGHGECHGEIALAPRGAHGFGYDPVFVVPSGKTLAELTRAEKAQLSHRGAAMRAIAPQLLARLGRS